MHEILIMIIIIIILIYYIGGFSIVGNNSNNRPFKIFNNKNTRFAPDRQKFDNYTNNHNIVETNETNKNNISDNNSDINTIINNEFDKQNLHNDMNINNVNNINNIHTLENHINEQDKMEFTTAKQYIQTIPQDDLKTLPEESINIEVHDNKPKKNYKTSERKYRKKNKKNVTFNTMKEIQLFTPDKGLLNKLTAIL